MTNHGEMFTALADPTRRAIFERLAAKPAAVGQLAAELPVSRPAVSQHLKVLKDAGLVTDRAEGTRRIYTVNQAGIAVARGYFDQFWTRSLAAFAAAADGGAAGSAESVGSVGSAPQRTVAEQAPEDDPHTEEP